MTFTYDPKTAPKKGFKYESDKPSIDTIVDDIYEYMGGGGNYPKLDEDAVEQLTKIMAPIVIERLKERRKEITNFNNSTDGFKLRMSNYGQPHRKLWYEANVGTDLGATDPRAFLNFLIGDMWEAIILFIAKQTGHEVAMEQETVHLDGLPGHMDAVIDGWLVDVKSASKYSFERKFTSGAIFEGDDPFAYIPQLKGYGEAAGIKKQAWLVANKENGQLATIKVPEHIDFDAKKALAEARKVIKLDAPPEEKCFEPEPHNKRKPNGNMVLNGNCKFCVSPETLILTKDMEWKPASDLDLNDEIIGFQEERAEGEHARYYEFGRVLANPRVMLPRIKVTLANGSTCIVSEDHKFLVKRENNSRIYWVEAKDLLMTDSIRFMSTWTTPSSSSSYDYGYLAGILDGEGCYSSGRISFAQNEGVVLETCLSILRNLGINYSTKNSISKQGVNCVIVYLTDGFDKVFEVLGTFMPPRLLQNFLGDLPNRTTKVRYNGYQNIASVDFLGEGEVIALETSCKTYISNGFFSHNCAFKEMCWKDDGLRAFQYATGPVYFTHVEKEPKVEEIDIYGKWEEEYAKQE